MAGLAWRALNAAPRPVLVFPDTEEILFMFTDAAGGGGIGHRIEVGPKVGIQKRTSEGGIGRCGCGDRTRLHRKPEGRLVRFRDESWISGGDGTTGYTSPQRATSPQ